ncbi:MAG: AAA family ATPase [Gammaproteobacteria bacterium]|jgi:hypothetical protein
MSFYVVFLHGPAAAGKHTVGTRVSERLGIPLFHNHLTVDLVKSLFEFGTEPFNRLRAQIWRAAFEAASSAKRSFVFTFNPEVTVDPGLIVDLHDTVVSRGGRVHYVALHCSDDEIERRIGNESRRRFGKLIDPGLYRELKAQGGFAFPPLPDPLITIDTEQLGADEAAIRIVGAVMGA